jgi:DNA helicase-2/ATP-dependent DNA helicase PcrA
VILPITEGQLIAGIEAKNGFPLDQPQIDAIQYGGGPLLIAAGPGTGKTEVLVARCLKLICCDLAPPGSIMLTTFTEKAAKSLQDRLAEAFLFFAGSYSQLNGIDPSEVRLGTLHSLCNDILQQYRYTAYQNLRLLDDVGSALLLHKSVVGSIQSIQPFLFAQFSYLFGNKAQNKISKWDWVFALQKILNRLIEDEINIATLQQAGGPWAALAQVDGIYEQALANRSACDFSRLLRYFRDFLNTGQGNMFLNGDGTEIRLPLRHLLVDEYQDTNPIQESIYLRLADAAPHNITVVGDDDQALYRFRGGTVECMVGFSQACQNRWAQAPTVIYLSDNHRSHSDIVQWCNTYISSFPQMAAPNVRIPGKPTLGFPLGRIGAYPAVGIIRSQTIQDAANGMAALMRDLRSNGVIQDYSQCVLLLRSTKNSPYFAGPYLTALSVQNIPVYNPRSKDYLEQPEVAQCLGAFVRIIDPQLAQINTNMSPSIRQLVLNWITEYDAIAPGNPQLAGYVTQSAQAIASRGISERITPAMPTILYRIFSHQPFATYQANPATDLRLSKLTRLFEQFCSQYGFELRTDDTNAGQLPGWWYGDVYYGLCGYLERKGMDDDEDEEVVCPQGYFPLMTVHQAKGLEFDFVFVGNLGASVFSSDSHELEEDLRQFRYNQPVVIHPIAASMWHDEIRQHFVAFSRAKFALILIATESQLRKTGSQTASFGNQGGGWVRQNIQRL